MKDSAARPEPQQESPTSPHELRHVARTAALCSFLTSKHPWHPFPILTCGLTVVVAFVVGAVYVTYLFEHRNRDMAETRFCCPNEVDLVVWYVNRSVIPCKDFFGYVCSNIVTDGRLMHDDQSMHLWQALITGHTAADVDARLGDTGRFVTAYYRSCMEIATRRPSLMRSFASALVKVAWNGTGVFKSREAFTYMITASVVYKLPSVVYVSFEVLKAAMSIRINLACNEGEQDFEALAPVLDALSATLNATATTVEAVRRYALKLCSDLPAASRARKRYATVNESAAFDREVWNIEDVRAGLQGCGFSLWNATSIEVQGVGEARTLYSALAANGDREAMAKTVAYLVWYSVVLGSGYFYRSYDGTAPSMFRVCTSSLHFISEIERTFAASQFTSPEKDVEVRKMFARLKNSVYAGLQRYSLIDDEDTERSESFFKSLQIVSYGELPESAVPIPNATESFGENLLRGRAYGFEVVRRRLSRVAGASVFRYGHVDFSGDKWLQLSSVMYRYLRVDSGEHDLPNYAFVGRILAEALWYMLVTHVSWSPRTVANIERFTRCFVQSLPGGNWPAAPFSLVITALGLASALHALNATDWYEPVVIRDAWRVSHAQFFLHSHHLLQVSD
ncbi:hypothetical protein HPB52_009010 [Rhipicephalus sanguineus]|uniref:Uncharacterized protein n=1 Tax=Rhipicephalus sanguineus TaxID=34632 RepID=A0A9D4PML7_RHISA|nr:hypothetical protein HPB52_009010 [Rhipicephalus sanguineus]